MRLPQLRRWHLIVLAVDTIAAVALIVALPYLLEGAARVAGFDVRLGAVHLSMDGAQIHNVRLEHDGALLTVKDASLSYRPLALLLDQPELRVIHHQDGSWIVPWQRASLSPGASAAPQPPSHTVDRRMFALTVYRGSVTIVVPDAMTADARRVQLNHLTAVLRRDTNGDLTARASLQYAGDSVKLSGLSQANQGRAKLTLRAPHLQIAPLVNALVDRPEFVLESGQLDRTNLQIAGTGDPGQPVVLHLGGSTELRDGTVSITGMKVPIEGLHGSLILGDAGLLSPELRGTLADLPLVVHGGLVDLANLHLALSASTGGEAEQLRRVAPVLDSWPVHGDIQAAVQVLGPVANPRLAIRADAGRLFWDDTPLDQVHADVDLVGGQLTILDGQLWSGGVQVDLGGAIALNGATQSTFVGTLSGDSGVVTGGVVVDHKGGILAVDGALPALRLAATGRLSPDGTQGRLSVFTENAAGEPSYVTEHLKDGILLGGGAFQRFSLPGVVTQLDGTASLFAWRAATLDDFEVSLAGIDPLLLHRLAPQLPDLLYPESVQFHAAGDERALTVSHLAFAGKGLGIDGQGILGRESSSLTGTARVTLQNISPFVHGEARGPFAAIADAQDITLGTPGLALTDGSAFGYPLAAVQGTLRVDDALDLALEAESPDGRVLLSGDPQGRLAVRAADLSLRRLSAGTVSGMLDGVAWIHGTDGQATVLLRGGRFGATPLGLLGVAARQGTTAQISHASLRMGLLTAGGGGSVALQDGTPEYHLHASLHHAEAGPLVASLAPALANFEPEAQLNGRIRVDGRGAHPLVSGALDLPTGDVNGLALSGGHAAFAMHDQTVAVSGGSLQAGASAFTFAGSVAPAGQSGMLHASTVDLGELVAALHPSLPLSGVGSFALDAKLDGTQLTGNGALAMRNVSVGQLNVGQVVGHWYSDGPWIVAQGHAVGSRARASAVARIAPRLLPGFALDQGSPFTLFTQVANLDIASRLALLGIHAPVTGIVDAQARLHGTLRAPSGALSVATRNATLFQAPVQIAKITATFTDGVVRLREATLKAMNLEAQASGTLQRLSFQAPLSLAIHAVSAHLSEVLQRVTGRTIPVDGMASTSLTVTGTLHQPHVDGVVDLEQAKIFAVPVNEAIARYTLGAKSLTISDAQLTLPRGTITAAGTLPLSLQPLAIGPADAPLSVNFGFNGVDLAGFASQMPADGKLAGQLDGGVALEGTPAKPRVVGAIHLTQGRLELRPEHTTVDQVQATLRFAGNAVRLTSTANLGGGTLDIRGRAVVPDLTDIDSATSQTTIRLRAQATNAKLDIPGYGQGTIDGLLQFRRIAGGAPQLLGNVSLHDALLPTSPFLAAHAAPTSDALGLFAPTALHVGLKAGSGVRVRSGAVDLGATGSALLAGTVAAPTLDGGFSATGGTVTYLNRSFRVDRGRVAFDAGDGINPLIDATATTVVNNPDPSSIRNTTGQATITLSLHGRPDHLIVALSSDPSYSREQILGLLLDASLVGGVDFGQSSSNSNGGLATVSQGGQNAQISVQDEAISLLDAQFSQNLLSPITSALGGAFGLSDLGVSVGSSGNLGLSARRRVSGNFSVFFADELGIPARQSLGFDFDPNDATAIQLSVFQEQGSAIVGRNGAQTVLYEPGRLTPVTSAASKRHYQPRAIAEPPTALSVIRLREF